ncbi:MAG: hypothetical protein A4E64_01589 [Syntrophorhabdus sp. PtaU1.Bin058]|nr:MAG: hypothetical protein A4E64_01589 [Syntrophorhabdus sp. PtaU1.Bin058]
MAVTKKGLCAIAVLLAIVLHGCASSPDKTLARKDLQSIDQINLVRYEFPGYMKETTGSKVASTAIAVPFMLFGAIGGGIGGGLYASVKSSMMTSAGKEMQNKYNLPDFTGVVHKEFSERLPKNFPDWPRIIIEPNAVSDDYQNPSGCFLSIKSLVMVSDGAGLQTDTIAQMVDSTQNVLWQKRVSYKSSDFNRPCKFEQLEADNGKLLHEEITLAVEKTVTGLIGHLKNGTDTVETDSTE